MRRGGRGDRRAADAREGRGVRRPRRSSPGSPSPPAPPSLGVAAPRGRGRCGNAGVWTAGPRNCCRWKPPGRGAGSGAGGRHCAKAAGEGLGREDERGLSAALGARPPASRRSAGHLPRASPLTPPPLPAWRVPSIFLRHPHRQLSFRSSARQNAPSSDLRESARASRGGGVWPSTDPAPGGPGSEGAKGRLDEEDHEGTVSSGALGPGCRASGCSGLPGLRQGSPTAGKGKPEPPAAEGVSCPGLGGQGQGREGKTSGSQKIPKGAPPQDA